MFQIMQQIQKNNKMCQFCHESNCFFQNEALFILARIYDDPNNAYFCSKKSFPKIPITFKTILQEL